MDLLNFIRVLARRIWLILAITLIATTTTYLITRGSPKVFKSTAKIATGITDKIKVGNEQAWIQMEDIRNQFNNLLEAMKSRQAVNQLSYKLLLHDLHDKEPFRDVTGIKQFYSREALAQADSTLRGKHRRIEGISPHKSGDALLQELLKKMGYDYESLITFIKVDRERESDYLKITFESEDPYLSSFAANAFAEEFIRYYKTEKGAGTDARVKTLEDILAEKRKVLETKREDMTDVQKQFRIIDGAGEGSELVNQISAYERMRDQQSQKVASMNAQLAGLNAMLADKSALDAYGSRGDNPRLIELRERVAVLESRYISSGSNNPALKDSIDRLREERIDLAAAGVQGIAPDRERNLNEMISKKLNVELQLDEAQQSLQVIEGKLKTLSGRKYRMAEGTGVVGTASAEYEMAENEYETALKRFNDALETTLELGKHLRVFEFGRPAERAEASKALLLVTFSGLASVALCIVVLFLLEYIDLSIKTPSNFLRLTGLPLLGSLNHLNAPSLKLESLFSDRSNNPTLEKFKQLLRKLRFELVNAGAKIVLFTSAKSGEGKTLTLIALAYSLSLNGRKVLLVDTNFKNPTLTNMLQARPILEDWIGRDGDPADAVSRSEFNGIDVIGCAGGDYSPSEVLYDDKFYSMIQQLSEMYDHIFLEGPSLNDFSDSKELVNFSEKVVAIFSSKSTLRQSDKESIAYLQDLDDKLIGAVLNDVEAQNLEL